MREIEGSLQIADFRTPHALSAHEVD
jgi:hypothetical protein